MNINNKILRIGTDCSGIEAPIQALIKYNKYLENLGQKKIEIKHCFSSEIDKYCIESIKANYNPDIIFNDIKNRNIKHVPDIDLYICGFPCQPFSIAGDKKGLNDIRGTIFWNCIDLIKYKKPSYFILENVKGLLHINNGLVWNIMKNELNNLTEYNIKWKILNTKDYGIPHNRERLYIIGINKNINKNFTFPIEFSNNLKPIDFIDKYDNKIHTLKSTIFKNYINKLPDDAIFVDLAFAGMPNRKCLKSNEYVGCLNTVGLLWCKPMNRYANIKELLSLQGFPTTFKQVISDRQLKKQLGNSMSINVLTEIFKYLL
jgi:DNA (cytosine-5)-methyltransferase 1